MTTTANTDHSLNPLSRGQGVSGCSYRAKGKPWTGLSPTLTESNPGGFNQSLPSSVEPWEVHGQGCCVPYHRSLEATNLPKAWSHRMSMDGVISPLCITSEGPFFTARGHRFRGCRGHLAVVVVALNTSSGSTFQSLAVMSNRAVPPRSLLNGYSARGHSACGCRRTGTIFPRLNTSSGSILQAVRG
jgi:hypothetical protein